MTLFLLSFFSLYSLAHFYVFLKARAALALGPKTSIVLLLFMATMILAPLVVRVAEHNGYERCARLLAYIGYTWLGGIFLLLSASLAVDLYRLLLTVGERILQRDLTSLSVSTRGSFLFPLVLSLLIAVYGYFEAQDIRTEKIVLKTSKIPQGIGRLRIVQVSDVHLGLIVRQGRLTRILDAVKRANPDILVSTGDLVDGQINRLEGLVELLNEINPRYGKFAITGNHEFYAGLHPALRFTEKAGFTILRDEGVTVGEVITIAGVDDPTGGYVGVLKNLSEKELLSKFPRDRFTLLLKHRPSVEESSLGLFDLQLSGHIHKGQIFPFSLLTWLYYPNYAGLYSLPHGSHVYVSRGSGTWGPPIRFLAPPEVTVVELVHG